MRSAVTNWMARAALRRSLEDRVLTEVCGHGSVDRGALTALTTMDFLTHSLVLVPLASAASAYLPASTVWLAAVSTLLATAGRRAVRVVIRAVRMDDAARRRLFLATARRRTVRPGVLIGSRTYRYSGWTTRNFAELWEEVVAATAPLARHVRRELRQRNW